MGMGKTPKTNGQQARRASSPTRTGGSRATTSRQAGIPSRPKSMRTATVRANAVNASRRVKPFSTDDGLVDYLDSLPAKRMPATLTADKTAKGAQARRDWCEANGIPAVLVYDSGMAERRSHKIPVDKHGNPDTDLWRPDNAVLERLKSLARIGGAFGYTRAETAWVQTSAVCKLDWSNGLPKDFHGADAVYIYRT